MGLLLALATAIRFLLTGRKPVVFTAFTRFSQAAQQFRPGGMSGHGATARPDSADIVDVEAHEVRNVLSAPSPTKPLD